MPFPPALRTPAGAFPLQTPRANVPVIALRHRAGAHSICEMPQPLHGGKVSRGIHARIMRMCNRNGHLLLLSLISSRQALRRAHHQRAESPKPPYCRAGIRGHAPKWPAPRHHYPPNVEMPPSQSAQDRARSAAIAGQHVRPLRNHRDPGPLGQSRQHARHR